MSSQLGGKLLPDDFPESVRILSEFLDTLVQLVECHLVLQQRPPEFRLVVNKGDLGNRFGLSSERSVKLLRYELGRVLKFFEERGRDTEDAREMI